MKKIEVIILNKNYDQEDCCDFDTMKEARQWVKSCGLSKDYWNRVYERDEDYENAARDNVHTLRLYKNGECVEDWFPVF
jgi:hypothetical protein